MAKTSKSAWGIDIGNGTFKALKLGVTGEGVEVQDFVLYQYDKIISPTQVEAQDRASVINHALERFLEARDLRDSTVVVSIPGQSSFARFIKLPPVESKRIPELVRFEAIQQIPFDIDEVEWDWQTFQSADSSSMEVEVGIFAIKRDLVGNALAPFTRARCKVDIVQMAPMALYNFLRYDQKGLQDAAQNKAVIAIDIGADNTDLVVADGQRVWQRAIPIGGNQFTAAIQKAFKLSFTKAENIKRTASTSKYARQLFQAMRPVFADLAAEIQRTIGFYSSTNRQVDFRQVIALGSTVKLPGLIKFLQQSLSLPVKRLDNYDSLQLAPDVSMAQFSENISNLTGVYGLALQGLGLGAITSNILPREIARATLWKKKQPWFAAAAAVFLVTGMLSLLNANSLKKDIASESTQNSLNRIAAVKRIVDTRQSQKDQAQAEVRAAQDAIAGYTAPYQDRTTILRILRAIRQCTPSESNVADPEQRALYQAYRNADRDAVVAIPRAERQQVFLTTVEVIYVDDLHKSFTEIGLGRSVGASRVRSLSPRTTQQKTSGFAVLIEGYTPHQGYPPVQDSLAFLQPDAGPDRSRWGFFNHLRYLGKTRERILEEQKKQDAAAPDSAGTVAPAGSGSAGTADIQLTDLERIAAELPFETFVDPTAANIKDYFDASQGNWIQGDIRVKTVQPAGLGIAKREERVSSKRVKRGPARREGPRTRPGLPRDSNVERLSSAESVLIDPLTHEPISSTYARNLRGDIRTDGAGEPIVEHHDYWFRVLLKIKRKDAGKPADLDPRD